MLQLVKGAESQRGEEGLERLEAKKVSWDFWKHLSRSCKGTIHKPTY